MTERQRITDEEPRRGVGTYPATAGPAVRRTTTADVEEDYHVDTVAGIPKDLVRWGPIWAGLFTALSTLILLSVLGLAIGLSTYDATYPAQGFGLGTGIWGIISTLLAFGVGGWLSAYTASVGGRSNGILNGSMVWLVAIPLILFLLGSGLSALLGTAITAAAQTGLPQTIPPGQLTPGQITPQEAQAAAEAAADRAWWTLVALVLGLLAAALGGLLGARSVRDDRGYPVHA